MRSRAVDLQDLLHRDGALVATHAARLLLIVLVAITVRAVLNRAVRRAVRTVTEGSVPASLRPLRERAPAGVLEPAAVLSERHRQRAETLGSILRSVVSAAVATVAGAMALSELGLDLAPVVASAGIVGVALGFGAQTLVKDLLTGIFMLLEDQYGVGDVIDAGPASGVVEGVGLRTTRLRDVDGTVWHIRNGEIARVGNKGQGFARALLDLPLAPGSDVPAVRALALQVADQLRREPGFADRVIGRPEVWGLEAAASDGLLLRMVVPTAPLQQWAVARELRERLVAAFAAHAVELGPPREVPPGASGA